MAPAEIAFRADAAWPLVALWSASKGAKAMITGINIANDQPETRRSWKVQTLALAFSFGFVVFGIVSLALIAFFPWMFERLARELGIGPLGQLLASAARWALLLLAIVVALSVAYRYAPDHHVPCKQCVRWGAAVASVLWLLTSMGFSWDAASFGSFNETYGSLAGIVVLLLWLQISSYAPIPTPTPSTGAVGYPRWLSTARWSSRFVILLRPSISSSCASW